MVKQGMGEQAPRLGLARPLEDDLCRAVEVGGWRPVPKLNPGSSTITACPFRGRRRLQLGLSRSAAPIARGLKCSFQDSAQSSCRILFRASLPGPMSRPLLAIRLRPNVNSACLARDQSGLFWR